MANATLPPQTFYLTEAPPTIGNSQYAEAPTATSGDVFGMYDSLPMDNFEPMGCAPFAQHGRPAQPAGLGCAPFAQPARGLIPPRRRSDDEQDMVYNLFFEEGGDIPRCDLLALTLTVMHTAQKTDSCSAPHSGTANTVISDRNMDYIMYATPDMLNYTHIK